MSNGRSVGQRPKLQSPEQWQALTTRMRMFTDTAELREDENVQVELVDEEMEAWREFRERLVEQRLKTLHDGSSRSVD